MRDDDAAELVERVLEARAAGRVIDLHALCGGQADMVAEVERLLQLDEALDFEPPSDALVGSVVGGRYELHNCIGVGAMGAVYAATDTRLARKVAVKVLQNGIFASPERHERFAREARVLASLRHPNIVSVYDHGRAADGMHFIVMELLVGVPLAQILEQAEIDGSASARDLDSAWLREHFDIEASGHGYIPQVSFWCSQIADALREAHEAGITHRDVKPSNIFVDQSGSAILLDFGIAAREGDAALTAQGSTIGTPWYMAPEQAHGRSPTDKLVDVYGLCATLYHLAARKPPFEGAYAEVLTKLVQSSPPPPGRVRPELSRDLCAIVEHGMEREPSRRYPSMRALAEDLSALCAQLPVRARPITRLARLARHIRQRPGPWIAALVVIAGIATTIPLVGAWRDAAEAEESARVDEYQLLRASLPPALAFEGSFALRPKLPHAERDEELAKLSRILELEPGDAFARLLRSALLLDKGAHGASLEDVEHLVGPSPSPMQSVFLARYRAMDLTKPSVEGLDLDEMPPAETERDRLLLGFQLHRMYRNEEADDVLALAQSQHARNLRIGVLFVLSRTQASKQAKGALLKTLVKQSEELESTHGVTARTRYFWGSAQLDLGSYQSAGLALEKSRELCPRSFGTLFNSGCRDLFLRDYENALVSFRAAHELRPWNQNAIQQISVTLAELSRFDEAKRLLMDSKGRDHTVEAWMRDFQLGYVEALRAVKLFGEDDVEASRAAERDSIRHYMAALEKTAPKSSARRTIQRNAQSLSIHRMSAAERSIALLKQLEQRPQSQLFLASLLRNLASPHSLRSEEVRRRLREYLHRLAGGTQPSPQSLDPSASADRKASQHSK